MQYGFNTAKLFGITPFGGAIEFGGIEGITLDFSRNVKELQGTKAFPEIIALGKGKVTGKATSTNFYASSINLMMSGMGDVSKGQRLFIQEPFALATSTPSYTVKNAANFYKDLGVKDTSNSMNIVPFSYASSAPTTGQYSLDGTTKGKYLFSADDATAKKSGLISYIYEQPNGGSIIQLNNPEMAIAQYFAMFLQGQLINKQGNPKQVNVWLNACVSSKIGFGWKIEDFNKPQFDFQAFSDDLDSIGWMSIGE